MQFFTREDQKISPATESIQFSGPVNVIHQRRLPETAIPAGYCALIEAYSLQVPVPIRLAANGERHRVTDTPDWLIMTPRHQPQASLRGHLTFALKYEGLDLAVLKRLFCVTGPVPIADWVREEPTGSYARRIWFLFEWLTGDQLDLPDATGGRYVAVLDDSLQFDGPSTNSSRHRIKNNLPGNSNFCPLVFKTADLQAYCDQELAERALEVVDKVPRDLLARTAAFLLLKDSRSSYAIEGERPPQDRIQRWGRAIGEAGQLDLDRSELLRLQQIVIGDERFIKLGFRKEGGFVGSHDRESRMPLPDHISARYEDLDALLDGMVAFADMEAQTLDPVVAAAILAFGFVYIHPFEDGNGRIHRYLFHHVLAQRGFNPPGVVFPISSAILERIDEYRRVLESYSARLLPLIEWRPTNSFNIEVTNDTGDFYRFFDATPHAEFLYSCVQQTIDVDLPYETDFLRRYDHFRAALEDMFDMPERTIDLLFRFLQQNKGQLSARARRKEFAALTDHEVERVENIYSAFSAS
ncbi:Fic family protein [Shimia sediminis]|uniref:Fic family protein n=1 Tax=Shimia sediminis TaxID=2497945 RepID=UPI001F220BFB|nr:Fic family protein [Shimia sediminis]